MEALDLKGILNTLKRGITSAVECADKTVITFAIFFNKLCDRSFMSRTAITLKFKML